MIIRILILFLTLGNFTNITGNRTTGANLSELGAKHNSLLLNSPGNWGVAVLRLRRHDSQLSDTGLYTQYR